MLSVNFHFILEYVLSSDTFHQISLIYLKLHAPCHLLILYKVYIIKYSTLSFKKIIIYFGLHL